MARTSKNADETFNEIVAQLDNDQGLNGLLIGLQVTRVRPCPSPPWDPNTAHRVALVHDKAQIQKRTAAGEWVPAPLHAPSSDQALLTAAPGAVRIFLSHASEDVDLAKRFITLIEAGLHAPDGTIRCTSVPGYKLEAGDDPADVLRSNLAGCGVVVGLLTPASLASRYVLMELGAAWAFKKRACQLLAPGVPFADLPGPFARIHALKMSDSADVADLLDTMSRHTGLSRRENSAKMQAALEEFVAAAKALPVGARGAASSVPAHVDPVTAHDGEATLRLKHWVNERDRDGRVNLAALEADLRLAPGLAAKCIRAAVGEWYTVEFGEGSAYLKSKPLGVVDVSRSGGSIFGSGSDF
ncbi:MAG: toll/interleukin-1 receptor domain-containing protein [Polyangiaceae bacterium]